MKKNLMIILLVCASPAFAHTATDDMVDAARLWISSLSAEEQKEALFDWDSDLRTDWDFLPSSMVKPHGRRFGLSIEHMRPHQAILAYNLLNTAMSQRGYLTASTVMTLEQVLHELEGNSERRNPRRYFISIFGKPSKTTDWSWRFEGHHLSINITLVKGHLHSITPSFFASNPAEVNQGPFKGLRALAAEEDLARRLIKSLNDDQMKKALFRDKAPRDILSAQDRRVNRGVYNPPVGVPLSEMNDAQRSLVEQLVGTYTGKYRGDLIDAVTGKKPLPNPEATWFAWAGGLEKGEGHYYRLQTPHWLLEYANTQNKAHHVHAVWRDFDGDFGADLMGKHFQGEHK